MLLVQLLVILIASRIAAWLLRWLGQPPVVGEMIAGLALGPLVFGALAPTWQATLFAPDSLAGLQSLSTLGLVLFMVVIGAELRLPGGVRRSLAQSGWIGGLAVLLPMLLGLGAAPMMYPELAPPGIAYWPFALFMATAGAVTALPVMARILKDRHLTRSGPGQMAIAAAAVADALAWLMLAVVVALISAHGDWLPFWRTLVGLLLLLAVCLLVIRPLSARALAKHAPNGGVDGSALGLLLIGGLACAATTEMLNLHPVFGAFMFGLCLPRDDRLLASLIERVEKVALLVLLPVFFALSGLSTSADLLHSGMGLALAVLLAVAILGKLLGGVAGARIAKQNWRDSFAIGSLMNARGMMELIVMKVGLDTGVIDRRMFTLLLIMAIVTTMMTTPMLLYFTRRQPAATRLTPRHSHD
jgi:Kef-type K+ transport system membrane component KefB